MVHYNKNILLTRINCIKRIQITPSIPTYTAAEYNNLGLILNV